MDEVKENRLKDRQFNPKYTFDSYAPGEFNRSAFQNFKSIVESPTRIINPVYMHGPTGVGKTHLLHAVGNYLLNKSKNINIRYKPCDIFTKLMVHEFTYRDLNSFFEVFHDVDYILVDDVQHLHLLVLTQEVFLEAIKAFVTADKQIILTSNCPPQLLPNLKFTTFSNGAIIQIQELDMNAKLSILRHKVRENRVFISDELLTLIAEKSCSGGFELEGIQTRLIALAALKGVPITSEIITEAINPFVKKNFGAWV